MSEKGKEPEHQLDTNAPMKLPSGRSETSNFLKSSSLVSMRSLSPLLFPEVQDYTGKLRYSPDYTGPKWIIFPDDTLKIIWDLVTMLLITYTITIVPYRVSFYDTETAAWKICDVCVDVLFMFDIFVNCFTAYYKGEDLITDFKIILKEYAKSWLAIDFMSAIPFSMIFDSGHWGTMTKLAKFPRLYRVLKLAKLFRLAKLCEKSEIFERSRFHWNISLQIKRFLYFILMICVVCHLLTCFWYFVATMNPQMNWIIKYGAVDKSEGELYLISLYWLVTTISTVGYGDITPANTSERAMCIIVVLLGAFFYSYSVGSITSIMMVFDKKRMKRLNSITVLQEINETCQIEKGFYKRLRKAIALDQSKDNKEQQEIFSSLPQRLAVQLNFIINKKIVEQSNRFFRNRPISFVKLLLELLKPTKLPSKEMLFSKGDLSSEIYFITKGEVSLFEPYLHVGITFENLGEGEHIGEVGVILCEDRTYSAKTNKVSELLVIGRNEFFEAIGPFESLKEQMQQQAEYRKEYYREKSEAALREFVSNRHLVQSIANLESDAQIKINDKRLADEKKLETIRDSLSYRTLKMISPTQSTVKELKLKLTELESRILILTNKLTK